MEFAAVIILRLLVPLTIFRIPLLGAILTIIVDYFDFSVLGSNQGYQSLDKILDIYYLAIALTVSLSWKDKWARDLSMVLFIYRMVGVILFEITQIRALLVIFPNLFESFFLLFYISKQFIKTDFLATLKSRVVLKSALVIFFGYKIYQELSLHVLNIYPWLGSQIFGLR